MPVVGNGVGTTTNFDPIQITADETNNITARSGSSDDKNTDVTLKIPKKTPGGTDGQIVIKGGKVTSKTDPT